MSSQYKVCSLFWEDRGHCYHLKNQGMLEDLLNDGWEISRVDTMPQTNFPSGAFGATNVYVLEKQSDDTKKSSASEPLPHDMGLRVKLDTNETYCLKSGWKKRGDGIYGLAVSYTDGSGIVSVSRPDKPVPIAIMNSHVRLAVSFDEHETGTTGQNKETNMKETNR